MKPRQSPGVPAAGLRVRRSPSRHAPAPSSAAYAVPETGCQIQDATVCPERTSEAITAKSGRPAMKFAVPSTGSTSQTAGSESRALASSGSAATASSPTTGTGSSSRSRLAMITSASRSATVTTSPGAFSITSPAASARKRGTTTSEAASARISATFSISTCRSLR